MIRSMIAPRACDVVFFFFFSSRRRHTRLQGDWSSDVCSSDLLTTDVRRRREDYVSADGEQRVTLSGSREEMARTLEEYAKGGLDYLVAYIYRDEVREIIADVMKFSGEIIRSYS